MLDNLFLINDLPDKFFSKLASKNRDIYIDALLYVYRYFDTEINFRQYLDNVADALMLHLEQLNAELCLIDDESDEKIEQKSHREMAKSLLKEMSRKEIGWMEIETEPYDRVISQFLEITPYGLRLAEFLEGLRNMDNQSLSNHIINIYNNLRNEDIWRDDPYRDGLMTILSEAKDLSRELKRLTSDIKKFVQMSLNEEISYETITDGIINFYSSPFLKDYIYFCKRENLISYREKSIEKLYELKRDSDKCELVILDCASRYDMSEKDAEDDVYEKINQIINFLDSDIRKIVSYINKKILTYNGIANSRLAIKRNYNVEGMQKYVEDFTRFLADICCKGELSETPVPEDLRAAFAIRSLDYVDDDSLYMTKKSVQKVKDPVSVKKMSISPEDIEYFKKRAAETAYDPYSEQKCIALVNQYIEEKGSFNVSDLPLDTKEDVLRAVALIFHEKKGKYKINIEEGYVVRGNATIKNFSVSRV